jgi:hypothetical protein
VTADNDPARPIAGWTKYDVVAQAMAKIDKEGVKDKPIFVAIDFGGVSVTDDALDTWIEFISAIIRRDGMRLILVKSPPGQDLTAGTKLPDGNDFGAGDLKAIDVKVPDEGDVLECLRGLVDLRPASHRRYCGRENHLDRGDRPCASPHRYGGRVRRLAGASRDADPQHGRRVTRPAWSTM